MRTDIAREISIKILHDMEENNSYLNLILNEYLNKNRDKLNVNDINFISELLYGTISWKLTIDSIIEKYSKIPLHKISKWIRSILRIGIYQIVFLSKVPKSAAVNESVNLAKKYGAKSSGFVNAILRKVERKDYEEMESFSKKYSMPNWLIEEFKKDYSKEQIEQICQASNIRPKTTVRINSLKISKEEFMQELKNRKIEYEETAEEAFLFLKIKNITNLDLYQKGYFTVQDISAGMTAKILNPLPGETVLDACSAPGGKTTHLAEIMKDAGRILAWDLYKHRLNMVQENAKRLGIHIIETQLRDAGKKQEELIEKFDKILLDVPCLGIGVLKRKPDIKWQRKKEDISSIVKVQRQLLQTCSQYLRPEGYCVYSTCSILKEENENIVNQFIQENENWEIIEQHTILPDRNQDGFFICKLFRKS